MGYGARSMSGVPWHVEAIGRREGDPRRHRGRCRYYDKATGRCGHACSKCLGSAHCPYYRERPVDKPEAAATPKARPRPANPFPAGTRVVHRTAGRGVVSGCKDGILSVRMADGSTKRFDLDVLLKCNLIKKEA